MKYLYIKRNSIVMKNVKAVANILFITYVLCCSGNAYAQRRIHIMASHTIGKGHNTLENYKNIEDAGFTLAKQYYPTIEDAIEHLKTASKTNIKLIVECPKLFDDIYINVNRLRRFRAFGGYDVFDEPGAASFKEIGDKIDQIKGIDNEHIIWVNLYPMSVLPFDLLQSNSYEEYVEQYINYAKPAFVSFDSYAITKRGLDSNFFHNLEIISQKCRNADIPFWGYVLASQFEHFVEPTKGTMSFYAYNNLAYGAQGIEYFSYRRIVQGKLNITISPIDTNYQKMPIYEAVKELNAEIGYFSKFFYGNKVHDVAHLCKELPIGSHNLEELPKGINSVNYYGKGFVVSQFSKGKRKYLLFVNKDYVNNQLLTIVSSKRLRRLSYYSNERMRGTGEISFDVQPGSIVLLKL